MKQWVEGKLDLNHVQSFIKLGETGSFSQAASLLGITKAKMSRHIAKLEEELSQNLVYRTTRRVELTPSGKRLFQSLRDSMTHFESVFDELRGRPEVLSGTLRITAPEDVGVMMITPIVCEFMKIHPKVGFELMYSERVLDLVQDSIDLAIRIGELSLNSLRARKIATLEMALVATPEYLSRIDHPPTVEDLRSLDLVMRAKSLGDMELRLERGEETVRFNVRPKVVSTSMLAVRELVYLHQGIGLLPRFMVEPCVKKGGVRLVCPGWALPSSTVFAATLAKRGTTPLIRKFVDFLCERGAFPARESAELH